MCYDSSHSKSLPVYIPAAPSMPDARKDSSGKNKSGLNVRM